MLCHPMFFILFTEEQIYVDEYTRQEQKRLIPLFGQREREREIYLIT